LTPLQSLRTKASYSPGIPPDVQSAASARPGTARTATSTSAASHRIDVTRLTDRVSHGHPLRVIDSADAPTRRGTVDPPDRRPSSRRTPATGAGQTKQEATVPQYMLLIFADPSNGPAEGTPEAQAHMQEWFTYTEGLRASGAFVSGEALQPPTTATTVAVRNGDRVVSDGPFADTKEWLGGYYVIEANDLDAALDHAAKMPNIGYGTVEVRPVMTFE
jgi:hypothetical protein